MTNKTTVDELIQKRTEFERENIDWQLSQPYRDFIQDLQSIKQTERDKKSSFQILDMLTTTIEELSKYHSYKSAVKDLENIRTVLKNDWSWVIVASKKKTEEECKHKYKEVVVSKCKICWKYWKER